MASLIMVLSSSHLDVRLSKTMRILALQFLGKPRNEQRKLPVAGTLIHGFIGCETQKGRFNMNCPSKKAAVVLSVDVFVFI